MRLVVFGLFVAICAAAATKRSVLPLYGFLDTIETEICPEFTNVIDYYRDAMHNFTIETYKHIAPRGTFHFVVSPHAMWITLAAIAEGADHTNQKQLFQILNLPSDPCLRQKYYQLATSRLSWTTDVSVVSTRVLVIDDSVTPNPPWLNYVTQNSLLEVISAPIKRYSTSTTNWIRQFISASIPQLNVKGNSVLLDTMDYNGLWTTAFADAVVKRAPFYSLSGKHIGAVDLMRVERHGKIGYVPGLKAKILELPIGTNSQYSMIMALVVEEIDLKSVIRDMKGSILLEVLASLKETNVPIEVTLPQFTMNSEISARMILEDIGITKLWTDPEATRYISEPPAVPSSYVQRSTITLNKHGVYPPPPPGLLRSYGPPASSEDSFWKEFTADRPFFLGIFDTQTYSCLIATMYTQPTYPM